MSFREDVSKMTPSPDNLIEPRMDINNPNASKWQTDRGCVGVGDQPQRGDQKMSARTKEIFPTVNLLRLMPPPLTQPRSVGFAALNSFVFIRVHSWFLTA